MGRPKAWLEWHGTTLIDHVSQVVRQGVGAGPVVVVRAAGQELPPLGAGVEVTEDDVPGAGPLGGIAAALRALAPRVDVAFVAATDQALLRPAFVSAVLGLMRDGDDVVLPSAGGRLHPLGAAYRTSLAAAAAAVLQEGFRRPSDLFDRCSVRVVDGAALRGSDPLLESLENLNDRAAYEAARGRDPGPGQAPT